MKTMKQTTLVLIASLAMSASYAQLNLGVRGAAGATVTKAINTNAATQAATKATIVTSGGVSSSVTKAGDLKAKTTAATNATVDRTTKTATGVTENVKEATIAGANASLKSRASIHASEEAKANANQNSAVIGMNGGADVDADVNTGIRVNGKSTIYKTENKLADIESKTSEKANAIVMTGKEKSREIKRKVRAEARSKSQAAVHASEEAIEHANENSAVIDLNSKTSAGSDLKVSEKGVKASGSGKSANEVKVETKKG